jgi:KDO2-lipid IV(A) lauroyltransferase
LKLLPDRLIPGIGKALGTLCYYALPRYRRVARANLRRVFGSDWSPAEIECTVRRNFQHLGQTLVEFLKMVHWDDAEIERRVELQGIEHLEAALAAGRGALTITAHYGNWELLAARVAKMGYPVNVIARDADDPATNLFINEIRGDLGYRVISRSNAMRRALECLRQNELLAILLDQNTKSGEIFVDFFGHPAATATGPAVLARRTGAPLIPVFIHRTANGRHLGQFLPPVTWEATDDKEQEVREITTRLTKVIEGQVRAEPDQWFWIHNRWKRKPKAKRAPGALSVPLHEPGARA